MGVQAINGKSFLSFLNNTKTFEMMKFMITIVIENSKNQKLKSKLEEIINSEELDIDNILDTVNNEKYYNRLIITLETLSQRSKTMEKLYQRLAKNPLNFKTKSKSVLENLQKVMLLSFFLDETLHQELITEKPKAIILDNYSVHHALLFTELCIELNIKLIYLPPYSPKYNTIEQVWRTIKAKISRKYITSLEQLKDIFKTEFEKVVDNPSYWKNWEEKFLQ